MKNIYFFVLLSMIFGATNLNAQVRIGSKNPANRGAVLDLNANDTTNYGLRGLALPRVSLATNTSQLNGATPLPGMLVYNTNATLGIGVYFWSGTSNAWVNINTTLRSSSAPTSDESSIMWDTTVYKSGSTVLSVKIPDHLLGSPIVGGKRFVAEAWRPDMTLNCYVTIRYEGDEPFYDSIVCDIDKSNEQPLNVPTYFRLREF